MAKKDAKTKKPAIPKAAPAPKRFKIEAGPTHTGQVNVVDTSLGKDHLNYLYRSCDTKMEADELVKTLNG